MGDKLSYKGYHHNRTMIREERMKLAVTRIVAAVGLSTMAGLVQSADYCCTCKGQATGKTIEASNRGVAVGQCSLECGGFTNVTSGKCAAPPPAATAPAAAAPTPAPAAAGVVLAYKSEDCSGTAVRVTGSAARLDAGVRSFLVESGPAASAWEQADYAGRHTEPVGPTVCVAPGFDIRSIKLK
jgi:hypothetical protein